MTTPVYPGWMVKNEIFCSWLEASTQAARLGVPEEPVTHVGHYLRKNQYRAIPGTNRNEHRVVYLAANVAVGYVSSRGPWWGPGDDDFVTHSWVANTLRPEGAWWCDTHGDWVQGCPCTGLVPPPPPLPPPPPRQDKPVLYLDRW